jgi:hypothetical protein
MGKPLKTKKLSQAQSGLCSVMFRSCWIACLMLRRLSQIVWTKAIEFASSNLKAKSRS